MTQGSSLVSRHLVMSREAVFVRARVENLFAAYLAHVHRWESIPDGLAQTMMRQAIGGAIAQMMLRAPEESIAWTLNVQRPPLNLFVSSRNHDSSVVGRIFTEHVRTTEASRLFVEVTRPPNVSARSTIEVKGLDVLQIFEQYHRRSEQNEARFFELSEYDVLMVAGLPDVDEEWIGGLDRERALEASAESPRLLDEREFVFHCGCDVAQMLTVVRALYDDKPDELFQGGPGVETLCPRCGHRWWLARKDF